MHKHKEGQVLTWTLPEARVVASEVRSSTELPGNSLFWEINITLVLMATRRFQPPLVPKPLSARRARPPLRRSQTLKAALGFDLGTPPAELNAFIARSGAKVMQKSGGAKIFFIFDIVHELKVLGVNFKVLEAQYVGGKLRQILLGAGGIGETWFEARSSLTSAVRSASRVLGSPASVGTRSAHWKLGQATIKVKITGANGPGAAFRMELDVR